MTFLEQVIYGIITLNLLTFFAFGLDKSRAEKQKWRISEATLLWLAFLGGSPAAYAGRHLFRHKTRKQPFVSSLHAIAVIQIAAIATVVYYWGFH